MDLSKDEIEKDEYQKLYDDLNQEELKLIRKMLSDKESFDKHYEKLEKLWFISPPPSPEAFLDWRNGYIPKSLSEMLFPEVRKSFIEMLNPKKNYKTIVNYGGTRTGKSVTLRLLVVYIIVYIHHMRNVSDYLGLPTDPVIYLMSFKYDKSKQLILKPIYNILEKSPRYIKVYRKDKVITEQEKYGVEKIVYSEAAEVGEITLASGLQIYLGNADVDSAIGGDVIFCGVSELSYFINRAGTSEEEIFELYTNIADRIEATFPQNPIRTSFLYLDTSANNADSIIENHMLNELRKEGDTFFQQLRQWDVRTDERAPKYFETKETFKVITGSGKHPVVINASEKELEGVPPEIIIDVPIDYLERFRRQPSKSIRDIAGMPTVSDSKLIQNGQIIERIFDNPLLPNKIDLLQVDSLVDPKDYIWNQISQFFFSLYDGKNYIINRAANELRYLGLDVAHSADGDIMGLSMGHYEWSRIRNCRIFVYDFTLAIGPGPNGISIDAARQFILDIFIYSGLQISGVAGDTFQSKSFAQFLERNNLTFYSQNLSDKTTELYDYFVEQLMNDQIKAGKSVFLKNNLLNLEKKTVKKQGPKGTTSYTSIDHPLGTTVNVYNGDWEKSQTGYFAKDVSDSAAQALYLAYKISGDSQPEAIYEDENLKMKKMNATEITLEKEDLYDIHDLLDKDVNGLISRGF